MTGLSPRQPVDEISQASLQHLQCIGWVCGKPAAAQHASARLAVLPAVCGPDGSMCGCRTSSAASLGSAKSSSLSTAPRGPPGSPSRPGAAEGEAPAPGGV